MRVYFNHETAPTKGGIARDSEYLVDLFTQDPFEQITHEFTNSNFLNSLHRKIHAVKGLILKGEKMPAGAYDLFFDFQFSSYVATDEQMWHFIRVHDIFPISNPEWFHFWSSWLFKRSIRRSINHDRTIYICNSETTRSNLIRYFPKLSSKSHVIYCMPRIPEASESKECKCSGCAYLSASDFQSFTLMVGTIEPRKNYQKIVALDRTGRLNNNVVIVGRSGWKSRGVKRQLKATMRIRWIDDCCDKALLKIYLKADAFLSTSHDEGFNLPAGEACILGKTLILPRLPIYDELYGDSYLQYTEIDELVSILNSLSGIPNLSPIAQINYQKMNVRARDAILSGISM